MRTESTPKKSTNTEKGLAHYLALPYTIILRRDREGDVVARVDELPGCVAHGKDEAEALANLADMKRMWIEDSLDAEDPIPEPNDSSNLPSGKWVQRVPRSLHAKLVKIARTEEVSLNQLVTSMLSEQMSARSIQRAMEGVVRQCLANAIRKRPAHFWDGSLHYYPEGEWLTETEGTSTPANLDNVRSFMSSEVILGR